MKPEDVLRRVDELTELGRSVQATKRPVGGASFEQVDHGLIKGFRAAVLSFIEQQYSASHTHYNEFSSAVSGHFDSHIDSGMAILSAIRGEIAGGWLNSVKALVAAEIFSDFLEMAEHLLAAGYKDAAAVMIGSVLEEHLRQLAAANGVPYVRDVDGVQTPKKADALNADLAGAAVYNKLDQKAVTTWLDLRNKSAHGKYGEYEKSQVELMLRGVLEFMSRNPR